MHRVETIPATQARQSCPVEDMGSGVIVAPPRDPGTTLRATTPALPFAEFRHGCRSAPRNTRRATQRKIWKCPSTYQRMTNTKMVVKQPPPSFFAPQPAATPRKSLLICSNVKQSACQHGWTNKAATSAFGPGHWPRAECHAETRRYAPIRADRNRRLSLISASAHNPSLLCSPESQHRRPNHERNRPLPASTAERQRAFELELTTATPR